MSPIESAKLLVKIAESDPVYNTPQAVDEVIYLLAWHVWSIVDGASHEWTNFLGLALHQLRPSINSQGFHERFAEYDEVMRRTPGGEALCDMALVFQSHALGPGMVDRLGVLAVVFRLSSLMGVAGDSLLAFAEAQGQGRGDVS